MRMLSVKLCCAALSLVSFAPPVMPASAAPPTAASDEAVVVFRKTASMADTISCEVTESTGCDIVESTIATPYPCQVELIQVATVALPPYQNTFCNATISGRLLGSTVNGVCSITNLSGLQVNFTSGVNGAFSGHFFPIGAIFTPRTSTGPVTTTVGRARLKVSGIATLDGASIGTGEISALFDVVFTTPLARNCRSGKGYLVPVANAHITIRN
jgi:hypothetical protein